MHHNYAIPERCSDGSEQEHVIVDPTDELAVAVDAFEPACGTAVSDESQKYGPCIPGV